MTKIFSFRKTTKRNNFTKLFGGIGRRRSLVFEPIKKSHGKLTWRWWHIPLSGRKHRHKMKMIRRAHQGYRNRIFGTIQALKIRLKYGRRKPIPQFRR